MVESAMRDAKTPRDPRECMRIQGNQSIIYAWPTKPTGTTVYATGGKI